MNPIREPNKDSEDPCPGVEVRKAVLGDDYEELTVVDIDRHKARVQFETERLVRKVIESVLNDCWDSLGGHPQYPEVRIIDEHEVRGTASPNTIEVSEEMASCAPTLGREIGRWVVRKLHSHEGSEREGLPKTVEGAYLSTLANLIRTVIDQERGSLGENSPNPDTAALLKVSKPRVVRDFSELIGNTPLVLLQSHQDTNPEAKVWGKLEAFNPGGSVKDRTALAMILDAEKRGLLNPGSTIVESTSGNLGHALAMLARSRGYRYIAVVDSKTPADNMNLFKLLDVEVIFVEEKDEYGSTQKNRMLRAQEIARERPGCVNLNQYRNEAAKMVHYHTTGPEIYQQLNGKIDVLVGTVGTGSHLCGTAKFLKEKIPGLCVIGVEPEGSILFGGTPAPYLQNGNGSVFVPENYDPSVIDIKVKASDANAMNTVRAVARRNGLFFGGSSGAALYAAFAHAKGSTGPLTIVTLLPDGGSKYMNTVYSDEWMTQKGLMKGRTE